MEYPWTIVGWEFVPRKNDSEKHNIRLHCQQPMTGAVTGEGVACRSLYFNPEYVNYSPALGQKIIYTEGRFGIDRVIVVG